MGFSAFLGTEAFASPSFRIYRIYRISASVRTTPQALTSRWSSAQKPSRLAKESTLLWNSFNRATI